MADFSYYQDRIAEQQISERVARRQAAGVASRHRPRGRHRLARRLHQLAERIDG